MREFMDRALFYGIFNSIFAIWMNRIFEAIQIFPIIISKLSMDGIQKASRYLLPELVIDQKIHKKSKTTYLTNQPL